MNLEAKLGFSLSSSTGHPKTIVCLQNLTRDQDRDFILQVFKETVSTEDKDDHPVRLVYLDSQPRNDTILNANQGDIYCVRSPLSRLERQELLKNASVLLCPRRFNGFDISVLEAMHVGCPVVASVTGSAAEFLDNGHSGFTLSNDVSLWARQIN